MAIPIIRPRRYHCVARSQLPRAVDWWFDMGGRSSARQWNDILGIIGRQGASLDLGYLRHWADALRVRDLLERALTEVGLTGP